MPGHAPARSGMPSKFRMWSYFAFLCDVQRDRSAQSRPITPKGWFRRVGASRRGRRRGSCRGSRSGVEDPTDGNARRNSGTFEGAGAFASLCDLLPLHGGCPGRVAPRRAAAAMCIPNAAAGTFQSVATLFDTARLDLRLSTRHPLSPLSLLNSARGFIRALRQHICHKDCTHGLPKRR